MDCDNQDESGDFSYVSLKSTPLFPSHPGDWLALVFVGLLTHSPLYFSILSRVMKIRARTKLVFHFRATCQHFPTPRTPVRGSRRAVLSAQNRALMERLTSPIRFFSAAASVPSTRGPIARETPVVLLLVNIVVALMSS